MNREEYWIEAISTALEEQNKLHLFTSMELKNIAYDIQASHENIGQAFYVPTGKTEDIDKIKRENRELRYEVACLKKQVYIYRDSVARRRKVPIEDVEIDDGIVIYGRALTR